MKRYRQTIEEIEAALLPVDASWMDAHAEKAILILRSIMPKDSYEKSDVELLLNQHEFDVAITVIRLFLDLSKDDFTHKMTSLLGPGGMGIKRFRANPAVYFQALESLELTAKMAASVNRSLHWSDILVERLKGGRGSAIKGQTRGRGMENFVEEIVRSVFQPEHVAVRCRFTGAKGFSTEKADFAVPSPSDAGILIEVKAYGATGSKQTDVLGDIARIVEQKRNDTVLLLVTDGITWKQRLNDLRKLIGLQNEGKIQRIYTTSMAAELKADLEMLRAEIGL